MSVANMVNRLHLLRQVIHVAVFNNSAECLSNGCRRFEQYMYFCMSN